MINNEKAKEGLRKEQKVFLAVIALTILLVILYYYGKARALSTMPVGGNVDLVIKLSSISLDHNNSVGNEWSFSGTVNGQKIREGGSVEFSVGSTYVISLDAQATEADTYPDVGSSGKNLTVRDLNLSIKNTIPIDVTVTENKGRYKGNTAEWAFNFTVERKVSLGDVLSGIFN